MTNPAITGSMGLKTWSSVIPLSTSTAENILGNTASSNKVIEVDHLLFTNIDGTNSATITVARYDQDGTPMNSDVGADQAAIGADVVAGTASNIITTLTVNVGTGQLLFDKTNPLRLLEDQSLVVTASAADDISVTVSWVVKG